MLPTALWTLALSLGLSAGAALAEAPAACDLRPVIDAARAGSDPARPATSRVLEIATEASDVRITVIEAADPAMAVADLTSPAPGGLSADVEMLAGDGSSAALVGWRSAVWAPAMRRQAEAAFPQRGMHLIVSPDLAILLHRGPGRLGCAGIDIEGHAIGSERYSLGPIGDTTRDGVVSLILSGRGDAILRPAPPPLDLDLETGRASGQLADWVAQASPLAPEIPVRVGARQVAATKLRLPARIAAEPDQKTTGDEVFYLATIEEARPWALRKMAPLGRISAAPKAGFGAALSFGLNDALSATLGGAVQDGAARFGTASLRLTHPILLGETPSLLLTEIGLLAPDSPGIAGTMVIGNWQEGRGTSLSMLGTRTDGARAIEFAVARHGRGLWTADRGGAGLLLVDAADQPVLAVNGYLAVDLAGGGDLRLSMAHSSKATRLELGFRLPLANRSARGLHAVRIDFGDEAISVRNGRELWDGVRASLYPEVAARWNRAMTALGRTAPSD